jgi:long-chain fatty acid transport protein
MKKIFTILLSLATVSTVLAGGPMTNSNQSAAFLRSIARGTTLDTDAVYNNPAGTAFMEDGWHLGLNDQMAKQTRTTTSTYTMGNNLPGGFGETEFQGEVFSPLIPSVHLTWKKNRWAVMLGMGVNGGGGTIEYDNGLASFERIVSSFPGLLTANGLTTTQYSRDLYLQGSSMTLAFNAGVSFRITDWLSAAAMVRLGVTNNSYEAYLRNMQINPAHPQLNPTGAMMPAVNVLNAVGMSNYAALVDQELDVKQTGTSISPVLALYFQKGKWAASAKYEFKMATELKNETTKDINLGTGGMFPDGSKVKAETPALLALAASRECGPVKITAEYHLYFDKDAENSFSKCIEGNTQEYLVGAEWQISKKWLVSCGVQRTQLDMNESAYSDMNFSTSSWSTGIGAAYQVCDLLRINVGIMPTFYEEVTSEGIQSFMVNGNPMQLGSFKDVYNRTSMAWGIGLDFKF